MKLWSEQNKPDIGKRKRASRKRDAKESQ